LLVIFVNIFISAVSVSLLFLGVPMLVSAV
jgi:hypothetical protein